jgi:hypothetical protein
MRNVDREKGDDRRDRRDARCQPPPLHKTTARRTRACDALKITHHSKVYSSGFVSSGFGAQMIWV